MIFVYQIQLSWLLQGKMLPSRQPHCSVFRNGDKRCANVGNGCFERSRSFSLSVLSSRLTRWSHPPTWPPSTSSSTLTFLCVFQMVHYCRQYHQRDHHRHLHLHHQIIITIVDPPGYHQGGANEIGGVLPTLGSNLCTDRWDKRQYNIQQWTQAHILL